MNLDEQDMAILQLEARARRVSIEQVLDELQAAAPATAPEAAQELPKTQPDPLPDFEIAADDTAIPEPDLPPFESETPSDAAAQLGTIDKVCPHCGLDPTQTALAVPTKEDKLLFLHCLLGDQLFKKSYSLFGGRLQLSYRMLRTAELDFLWREALQAQRAGQLLTAQDCYAYIVNLRPYLQLDSITSTSGIRRVLPDGITRQTCPDAIQTWDELCPAVEAEEGKTLPLLHRIQEYVNQHVLRVEAVLTSARTMCDQFNKVVVVLEMNKASDPFWNEIETPP